MNMQAGQFDPSASFADADLSEDFEGATFLDRFRVTTKLNLAILANTIILAVIAAILVFGIAALGAAGERQNTLAAVEVRSNHTAIALADASRALDALVAGRGSATRSDASEQLARASQYLNQPFEFAGDAMPADIGQDLTGFRERVDDLSARLAAAQPGSSGESTVRRDTLELYKDVSTYAVGLHDRVVESADSLFIEIRNVVLFSIGMILLGVVIALVGARKIVGNVAGMVTRITEAMGLIAAGHTDTPIPGRDREDEIGAMARALAVFRRSTLDLEGLDAARADAAEQALALAKEREEMRSDNTQLLNTLADNFEESIGDVTGFVVAASEELRSTAEKVAGMANHAGTETSAAATAMDASSQHVVSAAAASDEFALSISEISKQASSSADLARNVLNSVNGANERIVGLNKATEEIGEIAELIQSIATRTNLLALNASIEAARGGEAGRGFAVVASEVKELAFKTSEATANVASRIGAIQNATGSSVEDLAGIAKEIAQLEQAATVIASAVDQQSTSGRELARNIDDVATTSREVAQTLDGVRDVSDSTGKSATQMVNSASEMQHQAEELRAKAQEFLIKVREANKVE